MRPLRLLTRAFGPYSGEQIVDFRQLRDRTLFLIHGPTGAGKTTILDAICFALYGECSGDDREARRMRSDHADPQLITEVYLDFRLGAEDYRIYRRPEQQRPKKRGDGTTTARAEATLWRRTGLSDDADEGSVVAAQWNSVTEHVERLLGFRSDQFRQVVMLPQGQFRKLLLADSRERQAILEVLFGTELYRRIEEGLKRAAKELENRIKEAERQLAFILDQAESTSREQLVEQRQVVRAKIDGFEESLSRLKVAEAEAQEGLSHGRQILEKLNELNQARGALQDLEASLDDIAGKRLTLEQARRASAIEGEERALEQRNDEANEAEKKLKQARLVLKETRSAKEKAEHDFNQEQGRQTQLEQSRQDLGRLEEMTQQVTELGESLRLLGLAQEKVSLKSQMVTAAREKLERSAESMETTLSALEQAKQVAAQMELLRIQADAAEKALDHTQRLRGLASDEAADVAGIGKAAARLAKAERSLLAAQAQYKSLEAAWIEGQAAILAERLSPGLPCPVCGSTDHPAPAHSDRTLPSQEAVKDAEEAVEKLKASYDLIAGEKAGLEKKLVEIQTSITLLKQGLGDVALTDPSVIEQEVHSLKNELDKAQAAAQQATALSQEMELLKEARNQARINLEGLERDKADALADQQRAKGEADARQSNIPEEFRDVAALNAAIKRTSQNIRSSGGRVSQGSGRTIQGR